VARIKIRRKDLRQPDEFMEFTGRVWAGFQAHRALAGALAAAAIAAVLITTGIRAYLSSRTDRAANDFAAAVDLYADGSTQEALKALPEVPAVGSYGALANLYRGHAATDAGETAVAVEAFRAALGGALPPYLQQEAHYGLGAALAAQGDGAGALEAYEAAANLTGPFRTDARLAAASHAARLGDSAKARTFYEAAAKDAEAAGDAEDDLAAIARWHLTATDTPGQPAADSSPAPSR
jgi:hypothetical protein